VEDKGKAKGSKPKKSKEKAKEVDNVILNIDKVLKKEDKLSTKRRPHDVNKIYHALRVILDNCFSCKKSKIPIHLLSIDFTLPWDH
jgi:hypothetical protein